MPATLLRRPASAPTATVGLLTAHVDCPVCTTTVVLNAAAETFRVFGEPRPVPPIRFDGEVSADQLLLVWVCPGCASHNLTELPHSADPTQAAPSQDLGRSSCVCGPALSGRLRTRRGVRRARHPN